MCLYQKGLFWQFSVNLLSVTSETYTRYSLNTYAEVALSFSFILLMAVDHKTTLMLREAQSFQIYVIHQIKMCHSLASCLWTVVQVGTCMLKKLNYDTRGKKKITEKIRKSSKPCLNWGNTFIS